MRALILMGGLGIGFGVGKGQTAFRNERRARAAFTSCISFIKRHRSQLMGGLF